MEVVINNWHNVHFTKLFNYKIAIIEKLDNFPTDSPWTLITLQTLELIESVSFLIAEGGTVLSVASIASHKANVDVNCHPSA